MTTSHPSRDLKGPFSDPAIPVPVGLSSLALWLVGWCSIPLLTAGCNFCESRLCLYSWLALSHAKW